jgi:hypothetical protein
MVAAAERRRELWLPRIGAEVNVAQEMLHTTFDIIAETMLSGRGDIDVDRVERGATDYSNSISWVILLTLLRAPRWMPYPGRGRVERARDHLRRRWSGWSPSAGAVIRRATTLSRVFSLSPTPKRAAP